jgi:hypothetical protein
MASPWRGCWRLFFGIAVREIELSLGPSVLAKLTEFREMALIENAAGLDRTIAEARRLTHVQRVSVGLRLASSIPATFPSFPWKSHLRRRAPR